MNWPFIQIRLFRQSEIRAMPCYQSIYPRFRNWVYSCFWYTGGNYGV